METQGATPTGPATRKTWNKVESERRRGYFFLRKGRLGPCTRPSQTRSGQTDDVRQRAALPGLDCPRLTDVPGLLPPPEPLCTKMKTKLMIAADLGLLRAYRLVDGRSRPRAHLELIDELRPELAHQKAADVLTDQPGRFPSGLGRGNLSMGEQHDSGLERRRRLIKVLAAKIDALLADKDVDGCFFAASAPIHLQLLDQLAKPARAKITETLARDLTKVAPAELLEHFATRV